MPCKPMSCQCGKVYLPQRYLMSLIGFLTIVLMFNMRVALNLIINEMIPAKAQTTNKEGDYCPIPEKTTKAKKAASFDKVDWNEMEQSFVRASFYIGYVPAHFPSGICADRFGARIMILVAMITSSLFTIIIPVIFKVTENAYVIGLTRVIVGAGQGIAMPSVSSLISKWIPKKERALLGSFALSGSHVGSIIGSAGTGMITSAFNNNWKAPFYFHGASGLLFTIVLILWAYTSPADSPFVLEEEREMLLAEVKPKVKRKVPVKAIFFDRVVWGMTIGQVGHAWVFFTFNTDLPKYLSQVLHYDIKSNGFINALPSLGMWISSIICGIICDWLFKTKNVRILTLRRWSTALGNIIPGIFCVCAGFAGCNVTLAVILLFLVLTTKGPFYCGVKVNYLDVTTNFAGFVLALNNGLSAISGIITPYMISYIAKDGTIPQWRLYFFLSLAISVIATIPYWFMTDDKRRPWDYGEDEVREEQ